MARGVRPPAWFWIVAAVLAIWDGWGLLACVQQFRHGADAMPGATDYDRALFAALPVWYNYVFLIATFGGLLGALALLLREHRATVLFAISLAAVVAMFGYLFLATDIVAHKGAAQVLPFPAVVLLEALFSLWFAQLAVGRGWLPR